MFRRLLVGIAATVLIAGCGSTAVSPRLGHGRSPMDAPTTEALPWPSVAAPTSSPAIGPAVPTINPAPPATPGVVRSATPSPAVVRDPALPPISAPWMLDARVALDDPSSYWDGVSGVLLASGDLLVVAFDGRTASIRDARTGRWRVVPGLPATRRGFGLAALPDGSALVVGGTNDHGVSYSSAYRFDPRASSWQRLGVLNWARSWPGVVLLPDGRVLVAGGSYLNGKMEGEGAISFLPASYRAHETQRIQRTDVDIPGPVTVPYASVEIFDPATGKSMMARSLACARRHPGVATLSDGRIMVADLAPAGCGVAEIYDPREGLFSKTGEVPPIDTKALVRQGLNLSEDEFDWWYEEDLSGPVALGSGGALLQLNQSQKHGSSVARSFRYRPDANSWVQFGPTAAIAWLPSDSPCTKSYSLSGASLVPLADGRVFVIGGSMPCRDEDAWWTPVPVTRIFDPARNTWSNGVDLPAVTTAYQGYQLRDGSVLLLARFGDYNAEWWPLAAIRYVFGSGR